jgi:2-dehydropantoate 2-reductase
MRILFLGAGATGGYFGGRALQAGADVTFLVRERRAALLREHGLVIKSPVGDAVLHPKLVTADTVDGHYDLVVVSCKAYDLDSAIAAIRPAVGPQSAVLPIVNGMAHFDVLDAEFGAGRVLGGLCQLGVTLNPQGEVVHMGQYATFVWGERDGEPRSARCVALEDALKQVSFTAKLSSTIIHDLWEKWVFLCSMAASTCLMRGAVGLIASADHGGEFLEAMLAETQAVAAGSGYPVRPNADASARKAIFDKSSAGTASMYRDLRQGHPIEAQHIVGDMIRRGAALGIPTPMLKTAYTHLQVYQAQR